VVRDIGRVPAPQRVVEIGLHEIAEKFVLSALCIKRTKRREIGHENWLPFLNIYRTMCLAPSPDFRECWREPVNYGTLRSLWNRLLSAFVDM